MSWSSDAPETIATPPTQRRGFLSQTIAPNGVVTKYQNDFLGCFGPASFYNLWGGNVNAPEWVCWSNDLLQPIGWIRE